MKIYISEETEPALNAAFEEWLLRTPGGVTEPSALLYQNEPAVLMGRNQNPWTECSPATCRAKDIRLMRRISGGGTVYHDRGNLNIAFIMPRSQNDPSCFTAFMTGLLQELGLDTVSADEHRSLFIGDRKVCGTAYAVTPGGALLHGCLLVNADLAQLQGALTPSRDITVHGGGIPSRRVPVMNLSDAVGALSCEDVAMLAMAMLQERAQPDTEALPLAAADLSGQPAFDRSLAKFRSDAWTYGHCADFTAQVRTPCGTAVLAVSNGQVTAVSDGGNGLPATAVGMPLHDLMAILSN